MNLRTILQTPIDGHFGRFSNITFLIYLYTVIHIRFLNIHLSDTDE